MSLPARHPETSWPALTVVTILGIQLLVLMEWVFFVTKPSFLAVLGTKPRLMVLGLTPLPLLALAAGLLVSLSLTALILRKRAGTRDRVMGIGSLVPATILGSLFLLMADNFANTMLGWSIESSAGLGRVLSVLLVLAAFVLGLRTARSWVRFFVTRPRLGRGLAGACLSGSLVALLLTTGEWTYTGDLLPKPLRGLIDPLPNILLIGCDGLNADHLSAYGYERETTPNLENLAPHSMFCENSFANCDHTTGSLSSLLTGRLPTETRVTYPPDILTGKQAYLHLPGLLKQLGYFNEQICIRHYGDAFDVNMRSGFDRAAFRDRKVAQASSRFLGLVGQDAGFLFETIVDRVKVRLAHTAGLGKLPSAFQEAVHADRLTGHTDRERYEGLVEVIATAPEPFFVHTHFMATHGTRFAPSAQLFSAGQPQDQDWMMDFYDDTILEFDGVVGDLIEALRTRGVLDNTLIVLYSDHGMGSNARQRTLLMFLFPWGDHVKRVTDNVQLLDIAPTVVDYLGLDVPVWMHGRSLLRETPGALRPVISTGFRGDALRRVVPRGPFEVDTAAAGPPFFSMGRLGMIVGQRVYSLDLTNPGLEVIDLPDHTSPLPETELPTAEAAGRLLVEHLHQTGWDVTGLPDPLPKADGR